MVGCHSILAAISDGETAKIAHVYIGTYDGQLTADSENRDSQQYQTHQGLKMCNSHPHRSCLISI